MAPVPLARLLLIQQHRIDEITRIGARIGQRDVATLNKALLQSRVDTINKLWAESRTTHTDIVLRPDAADDAYVTENRYAAMAEVYENTLDLLLTALSNLPNVEVQNPRRRERDDDDHFEQTAKLPRLDLQSFSGLYEDFDSFSDVFTAVVHNNPRIADITKLQYLKSCMKGPAAEFVKDVTVIGVNYAPTWKALRDRFHKPRLTINALLDSLHNLPYMKKENATDLRSFVDSAQRIVRALTNLRAPVSHWDLWLVHLIEVRLDPETRKLWESELSAKDQEAVAAADDPNDDDFLARIPKYTDVAAFLERRSQTLTAIHADKTEKVSLPASSAGHSSRKVHHASPSQSNKPSRCAFCSQNHFTSRCPTFVSKEPTDRKRATRDAKLCFNCLGRHKRSACTSKYKCKECSSEEHHTLLHSAFSSPSSAPASAKGSKGTSSASEVRSHVGRMAGGSGFVVNACNSSINEHAILLATAQVTVKGPCNKETRARVLLDQGSEATFISESLVQLLGLKRDRVTTNLSGIGGCTAGVARHATSFYLKSNWDPQFEIEVNAFVLPQVTSELPSRNVVELDFEPFKTLPLADPEFFLKDRVDILLGADVYGQLLRSGLVTFPPSRLVAQKTALGWVISGPTQSASSRRAAAANVVTLRCSVSDDLSDVIQRFWTVEEVPVATKSLKPNDEACEKLFTETHTRTADGRFQVRLPFKSELPRVAEETRRMASGSLNQQLHRLSRDIHLSRAYSDFMSTYIDLGHMVPVPPSELNNPCAWYIPHHAVVKGSAENLKIRVVFDASRRTRDKHCLNEYLLTGPALQSDLSLILLNWRRYQYVFTADIVKMFRQIRVAREDQDFQRILWTPAPGKSPIDYRLTTVTYGTACAPYLAIRTLLQIAHDEKARFPLGAACLESNTYVDDTFAGADELSTAIRKRDELIKILESAGITLDKWAANHSDLLPSRLASSECADVKQIDCDDTVKALGVHWTPSSDNFNFSASISTSGSKTMTKRSVYSEIARLFDPLGWLAPVTVIAKILMQDLWIEKCDWDEPLSSEIRKRWQNYCQSLSSLHTLSIDRWLGSNRHQSFEIHGFSDASSRAYAAAVYLRVDDGNGNCHVSLLTAKMKVAPVKTVSIPNLELCGATLLVKLVVHLLKLEFLQNIPIRLWSDSQIVLAWLKKHPCNWKTFVANRVSLIQTELPSATWSHVPTKQNPADLATRGATPDELRANNVWWAGPTWLISPFDKWPQPPKSLQSLHSRSTVDEPELLTRYSNLTRLVRITSWCLRPFLQKIRKRASQGSYPSFLTANELANAQSALVKLAQSHAFSTEIKLFRGQKSLPKRNHLCKLRPFVETDLSVLRVGGRLSNARLPHHIHYPPILPRNSALSRLFILHAHERAYHGGPTLTISILLRFAWVIGMRALVKLAIRKCVLCQRHAPRLAHQLMGNLPAERVTPARPFTNTGLDYAGPFHLRASKGRGRTTYKGWIALFVCFATKALHLEVVGDLTTASFLAAFRRFVSRRGICKKLFSDNATTFHGADAELRGMFTAASDFFKESASLLSNDGTEWTFIPPTTPHYGGLWEAGVKSTKNLLKKLIGERSLTFEEFSTVLAEIEACLNSRPLCQLTDDPEDLQALTPSHFLIGTASAIIPDEATPTVPENRLDRFQLLQRIRDQFWKRWSSEYVALMQERGKWRNPTANFNIGQLVLMKDDRYPPSKWPLGRVLELHAGADGLVRVVTVKTATNTLRRHIACLAPLDLHIPEDQHDKAERGK